MVRTRMAVVFAVLALVTAFVGSLQAQDAKEHRKPEGCTHDFSKFREVMKLSDDQRAQIEKIKEEINGETVGLNRCVIQHMMEELKGMEKGSDAAKKKHEEIEQKRQAMKAAMEKFEQARMAILTEEQKKAAEEMKAMMKEHREVCLKGEKGNPGDHAGKKHRDGEGKDGDQEHDNCSLEDALKEGLFHHHEEAHHGKEGHKDGQKN